MESDRNSGPLYFVERHPQGSTYWRVMGPNGAVGDFATAVEA